MPQPSLTSLTSLSVTQSESDTRPAISVDNSINNDEEKQSSLPVSTTPHQDHALSTRPDSASASTRTAKLAHLKVKLRSALRQFPDFPSPGILFEDILPIFADPVLHKTLLDALVYSIEDICARNSGSSVGTTAVPTDKEREKKPDVIVGLEARGFLFGPALALQLGAAFVPVRKKGKLPGKTWSASYVKEYGEDVFEMQQDVIRPEQRVLVVDDIIATGMMPLVPFISLSPFFVSLAIMSWYDASSPFCFTFTFSLFLWLSCSADRIKLTRMGNRRLCSCSWLTCEAVWGRAGGLSLHHGA